MVKILISILILLTVLVTGQALEDDFNNHPSDDIELGGMCEWDAVTAGSPTYIGIIPKTGSAYDKQMRMYSQQNGAYARLTTLEGEPFNYISFSGKMYDVSIWARTTVVLYDSIMVEQMRYDMPHDNADKLFEMIRSGNGDVYLYIDGVLEGHMGTSINIPYYIMFETYQWDYQGQAYIHLYTITTDGYVLGLADEHSPQDNPYINTASNDKIESSWSVRAQDPYGSWNDTEVYQIITTWIDTGQIVNTTTLNTSAPFGRVVYNRSSIMPSPNYGTYKFELTKDGTVMERNYITFQAVGDSGTLAWDKPSYVPYETGTVSYHYSSFDPVNYNYYIKTYDINGGLVDTQTLSAVSGDVEVTFDIWSTSSYYSLLVTEAKSSGTAYSLAFDTFDISNEVLATGITYDVTNNVTLNYTGVNFSQSTIWYNTTSDINGSYELTSLSPNNQIVSNASRTNYYHEAFSWTPLTSKAYDVNLYLFPTNITRYTHAIEGMVTDDMLYQGVGNEATVNIWNSTWSANMTTNWLGYYLFDNLHCDSDPVINETFNSGVYESIVQLANTSLVSGSQVVTTTDAVTTYTNVTDYAMDYINGTIQVHSAGSMAASTDYYINYSHYIPTDYSVNATCDGYEDSDNYTVTINSWSVQNILMKGIYSLNVTAVNAVTGAPLQEFAVTVDGETKQVLNGTARFSKNYGLYTVTGSKTDYYSDSTNVMMDRHRDVQLSLTPVDSEYYPSHYVEFVVCSIWGKKFPNVVVNVYNSTDTSGTSMLNGTTGTDGAITFRLDQNVRYTLTFIGNEITDKTVTLYPKNERYYILVSYEAPEIISPGEFEYDNVIVNVTSYDNNGTIHVSYLDRLDNTTALIFYVNQTNLSDIYNQTVIQSYTGFANMADASHIFTLTNYTNQEYIVSVQFTHTNFGERKYDFGVSFGNVMEVLNKIFSPFVKGMLAIFMLIFIALLFGSRTAEQGGLIVAVFAAILHGMGWFAYFGRPAVLWLAIALALIMMIAANINKKSKQEGF